MKTLVLYHRSCADGATAAWVAKKALPEAELIPCQYGDVPPDVSGCRVYCVDFSYPRATLLAMQSVAESIVVLDHHKTAKADLDGLSFCTFNMEKSGARLAWEHFFPGISSPTVVDYVEDRDLWRHTLPNSKAVNAAIRSYPLTPETIEKVNGMDLSVLTAEGYAILRYQDELIRCISQGAVEVEMDGHKVLSVQSSVLQSEIGEKLAEDRPFSVCWFDLKGGGRVYSLRSRPPLGIDVSAIAKKHGGGGHFAAAGFREERAIP